MAEHSGFFNSTPNDRREYNASEFAEYFSKFLTDGVYVEDDGRQGLAVRSGDGFSIEIGEGSGYIRGYYYLNDRTLIKSITKPDSVLNRIDRAVLRFDEVAREISIYVKEGEFSSSPVPPELEDTDTVKELSLAQIIVNNNADTVTIDDERLTDFCGMVELNKNIPEATLRSRWNEFVRNQESDFNSSRNDMENRFDDFMSRIEGAFDEGELSGIIKELDNKMDKSKIHLSETVPILDDMDEGDIWIQYEGDDVGR